MDKIILNTIIYYNNFDEICNYCKSVFDIGGAENIFIAIVVNKMDEDAIYRPLLEKLVISYQEKVLLFFPENNLGYMNGMIAGYDWFVTCKKVIPDFVIMSNTDIEFPDCSFFKKLISHDYPDEVWAIGPSVFSLKRKCFDNPTAYSRRTKKQLKRIVRLTSIPLIRSLYVWLSDLKARMFGRKTIPDSAEVYEIHGCFFIVKGEFAKQLSLHKFGALLYSEESYIAEEAYHNNKKVYYDSRLSIVHKEHSVTSKISYKRIASHISKSMKYIIDEYYD